MELCAHGKTVFFLPVNMLMVWLLAFLAVCLDISLFPLIQIFFNPI